MAQAAFEFGALAAAELRELRLPFFSRGSTAAAGRAPGLQHVVRHRKGLLRNAEFFLGGFQLVGAERLAMGFRGAGLVRRAIADRGLAGDQRRLVGFLRARDRRCNRGLGSWPSISSAAQPADLKRFTWSTESASEIGPSIEMPLSS